jgi:hypothetical protein
MTLSDLRRWARLPRAERRLLVQAAALQLGAAAALLACRFGVARRAVARANPARTVGPEHADRVAWAIAATSSRLPFVVGCLPQALAAEALLRANGIDANTRIGVGGAGADSFAHAWVEHAGRTIVGATQNTYLALESAREATRP